MFVRRRPGRFQKFASQLFPFDHQRKFVVGDLGVVLHRSNSDIAILLNKDPFDHLAIGMEGLKLITLLCLYISNLNSTWRRYFEPISVALIMA